MICRSSISLADHSWSIVSDQYGLHLVFLKVTTFSGKYTSLEPFSDRKTHSTYPSKHIYIFSKSQLNNLMISNLDIKIRTYNSWYHDKSHDESNIILSNRIWSYSNCSIWTLEQCTVSHDLAVFFCCCRFDGWQSALFSCALLDICVVTYSWVISIHI